MGYNCDSVCDFYKDSYGLIVCDGDECDSNGDSAVTVIWKASEGDQNSDSDSDGDGDSDGAVTVRQWQYLVAGPTGVVGGGQ